MLTEETKTCQTDKERSIILPSPLAEISQSSMEMEMISQNCSREFQPIVTRVNRQQHLKELLYLKTSRERGLKGRELKEGLERCSSVQHP